MRRRQLHNLPAERPDEFTPGAAEWPAGASRREFLARMAAALALAGVDADGAAPRSAMVPAADACPTDPSVDERQFATAVTRGGYAAGVLVTTDGVRPRRLDGNPDHPTSRGGIGAIEQAAILGLYDPYRSRVVRRAGAPSEWEKFAAAVREKLATVRAGELRLLTGRVTSPTLAAQIVALRARHPQLRWHRSEAVHEDGRRSGHRAAYGRDVDLLLRPDDARVVVALGGDPLQEPPGAFAQMRAFAEARRPGPLQSRWYSVESTPSWFGTKADHRLALNASEILAFTRALAREVGIDGVAAAEVSEAAQRALGPLARDLLQQQGAGLIVAGCRQPSAVHELVHRMQHRLRNAGATSCAIDPVEAEPVLHGASLQELAAALAAGAVEMLFVLGTNPVYSAPAELDLATLLRRVPFCAHLGVEYDETAAACGWHVPQAHELESWGDCRAHDGTVTIQQPLVEPIFGGRTPSQLLALLLGDAEVAARDPVAAHWRERGLGTDFAAGWSEALRRGFVAGSASAPLEVEPIGRAAETASVETPRANGELELELVPSPALFDGTGAANPWLQELPDPITKLAWGNAALISPALAARLDVRDGDEVDLSIDRRAQRAPVLVVRGQADDTVTVLLGGGRTRAGPVGTGVGFAVSALRGPDSPWHARGLAVRRTGGRQALTRTQAQHDPRGHDPVRELAHGHLDAAPPRPDASLYPPVEGKGRHAWGMSIDLQACIGCNACVVACQAENNVPVVGAEQVRMGRAMHWLRIDRYELAPEGRGAFEPMACQHCENAPCEPVCPVGATVHSSEGLNQMLYNRCIGTRYCANNCPWQVRRFNFLAYAEKAGAGERVQRNREVTVRGRGVMEKCTYCVQRIERARIAAKKELRGLRDGDIVPACQSVCPTQAIVFGDLLDPESRVCARKADPRDFLVLGELNTRPRTSYAAVVLNRNPEIAP